MEFLANKNFPLASIRLLRINDHKVESIAESCPGVKDREVIELAKKGNLVILTFDQDYGELIYRFKLVPSAGVIYFRFSPSIPEEPAKILSTIIEKKMVNFAGRFTVIEREGIRQIGLPK